MNPHKNEITKEFLGEPQTFRATFEAIVAAEQLSGCGIYELIGMFGSGKPTAQAVAAIIFAGLKGADNLVRDGKKLNFQDVAELVHKNGFKKSLTLAGSILMVMFSGDDEKPALDEKKTLSN